MFLSFISLSPLQIWTRTGSFGIIKKSTFTHGAQINKMITLGANIFFQLNFSFLCWFLLFKRRRNLTLNSTINWAKSETSHYSFQEQKLDVEKRAMLKMIKHQNRDPTHKYRSFPQTQIPLTNTDPTFKRRRIVKCFVV